MGNHLSRRATSKDPSVSISSPICDELDSHPYDTIPKDPVKPGAFLQAEQPKPKTEECFDVYPRQEKNPLRPYSRISPSQLRCRKDDCDDTRQVKLAHSSGDIPTIVHRHSYANSPAPQLPDDTDPHVSFLDPTPDYQMGLNESSRENRQGQQPNDAQSGCSVTIAAEIHPQAEPLVAGTDVSLEVASNYGLSVNSSPSEQLCTDDNTAKIDAELVDGSVETLGQSTTPPRLVQTDGSRVQQLVREFVLSEQVLSETDQPKCDEAMQVVAPGERFLGVISKVLEPCMESRRKFDEEEKLESFCRDPKNRDRCILTEVLQTLEIRRLLSQSVDVFHLSNMTCLTPTDRERLRCRKEAKGSTEALAFLLDILPKKENWWNDFIYIIEQDCEQQHTANKLKDRKQEVLEDFNRNGSKAFPHLRNSNPDNVGNGKGVNIAFHQTIINHNKEIMSPSSNQIAGVQNFEKFAITDDAGRNVENLQACISEDSESLSDILPDVSFGAAPVPCEPTTISPISTRIRASQTPSTLANTETKSGGNMSRASDEFMTEYRRDGATSDGGGGHTCSSCSEQIRRLQTELRAVKDMMMQKRRQRFSGSLCYITCCVGRSIAEEIQNVPEPHVPPPPCFCQRNND